MGGADGGVTLSSRAATVDDMAAGSLPVAFLGYLFVYPLTRILVTGLSADGGAGSAFAELLRRNSLLGVAWFTFWQAAASTVLTIVVALPITWVLSRFTFRGRSVVRAALLVPCLPTVVMGALLALAGPSGLIGVDLTGTVWIILWAHVVFNIAVVVRTVGGLWEHLDPPGRGGAAPRGEPLAGVPFHHPAAAPAPPWEQPPRSSSCSASPLSAWCSSSVEPNSPPSRWRSGGRWSGSDLPLAAALAVVQLVGVTAAARL